MKLSYNNIDFVRARTHNGTAYGYFVKMKSNRMSDNRDYCLTNQNGKTDMTLEYKFEWLPKTVQRFLLMHVPERDEAMNKMLGEDESVVFYIYR